MKCRFSWKINEKWGQLYWQGRQRWYG